jgi:hypothetical protein
VIFEYRLRILEMMERDKRIRNLDELEESYLYHTVALGGIVLCILDVLHNDQLFC